MPNQILDDNFEQEKTAYQATLLNKALQEIKFMLIFLLAGCLLLFVFFQFLHNEKIIAYVSSFGKRGIFDGSSFALLTIIYTLLLTLFLLLAIVGMSIANPFVRKLVLEQIFGSEPKFQLNPIAISLLGLIIVMIASFIAICAVLGFTGIAWAIVLGIFEIVFRLFWGGELTVYKYEVELSFFTTAPICFHFLYHEWKKTINGMQKKKRNE